MTSVLAATAVWWLVVSVIGWSTLPVARRLFDRLPDGGIAFARPLGLVGVGYLFWAGGFMRVVPNTASGAWFVVLLWVGLGIALARRDGDWRAFLKERRRVFWGVELLFVLALVAWALYRAAVPNIEPAGGEKYMEMAFINGILKSPSFPPNDPWMSGLSISYYYFGYLLGALLIRLSGLAPSVGFNLIIPTSFALTMVAAAGVAYSLAALTPGVSRFVRASCAALAAFLTAVIGNLEGLLEVAYWKGLLSAGFWNALNIKDLTVTPSGLSVPCAEPNTPNREMFAQGAHLGWVPQRFIWWWRGSRVIHDNCGEIIHEFPFFSFMLGDVHPHVVALPFVITVAALALNVLARSGNALPTGDAGLSGDRLWSPRWLAIAVCVGALGFLNAWDLPAFSALVGGAFVCWVIRRRPTSFEPTTPDSILAGLGIGGVLFVTMRLVTGLTDGANQMLGYGAALAAALVAAGALKLLLDRRHRPAAAGTLHVLRFAAFLVVVAVIMYVPYYMYLESQVKGVGIVDIRSRPGQWLVHMGIPVFFAVTTILAAIPLVARVRRRRPHSLTVFASAPFAALLGASLVRGDAVAAGLAVGAGLTCALVIEGWFGFVATYQPPPSPENGEPDSELAAPPATTAGLTAGSGARRNEPELYAAEGAVRARDTESVPDPDESGAVPLTFALMLAAVGLTLMLGLEFVFLRDLFNSRMNSVFKFSYQAWILLGLAGAYAPVALVRAAGRTAALVWSAAAIPLLAAGLVFTAASVATRTQGWQSRAFPAPDQPATFTLDGLDWWRRSHPGDLAAAEWLRQNAPPGASLVEAKGNSYEDNAHLSLASGVPTVLGWEFHERQWGRQDDQIAPRVSDLERLYEAAGPDEVLETLKRYGARYLVVGPAEQGAYDIPADTSRFDRILTRVYDADGITIYEVPQ